MAASDRFRECRQNGLPGIPAEELRQYLADAALIIDQLITQHQIPHWDLKPQNLLLDSIDSPRVKISDWGISASKQQQHSDWLRAPIAWMKRQTTEKTTFNMGTLPYMAPERFSGSWRIGPAADVFSLGIIGVQLLTGQLPTIDPMPAHSLPTRGDSHPITRWYGSRRLR